MRVAAVIPCYRETGKILGVLEGLGPECDRIYVVDDACPDGTGKLVESRCADPRVRVLYHETNQGVGGATLTGLRRALADGAGIVVKLDGDGQMDPHRIPALLRPVQEGQADYTKGNRFFEPDGLSQMPGARRIGNAALSFIAKLSTGYWDVFDPTNGFIAVHADVARRLPLDKLSRGYFFESDMLFRLNTIRAVVVDVPMPARYGDEASGLRPARVIVPFLLHHARNFVKRVIYNYFLRDFSVASLNLVAGLGLLVFGVAFGAVAWVGSVRSGVPATAGTVMLAGLPTILGVQLLLSFLAYDVQARPTLALHRRG